MRIGGRTIADVVGAARSTRCSTGCEQLALTAVRARDRRSSILDAARRPARASCAMSASATSRSTGRPARSPAARPSASRSPTRWARGWWTRCTCWTSRPSGCTRATPTACSACCAGCATRATPWWSSSTTSRRSGRPTSCSSWVPAPGSTAAGWCTPGRSPTRDAVAHRAVPHRREADRGAERAPAGRPAGSRSAAPRCTTSRASTSTSRSARSPRSPACRGRARARWCTTCSTASSRRGCTGEHSAKSHLGEPVGEVASLTGLGAARRTWCWSTSRRSAGRPAPTR